MTQISASMVKELRERSGAAMMDCKKALVESSGDFDKAFEWLRQKGVATAAKKAARTAADGLVVGKTAEDGRSGVILEVNCETDFVARNSDFVELTDNLAELALNQKPIDAKQFLESKSGSGTIADVVKEAVAKCGENIVVRRVESFCLSSEDGVVGLYIHALGGKMGALIEIASDKELDVAKLGEIAKDVAMHAVSAKPEFVSRDDVSKEVLDNERRIEAGKEDLAKKPPEIREKIVEGRVNKIISERCLVEQPFVKDPSVTIGEFLEKQGKELGGAKLKPVRFALFILGEVGDDSGSENNGAS